MKKKTPGFVINANFLMTIIIMIASAYIVFVVTTFSQRMDRFENFIKDCNIKIESTTNMLTKHLGWHEGKKIR